MTSIEQKIYKAMGEGCSLLELGVLYVRAHGASVTVYNKIDWPRLRAEIRRQRGRRALAYCQRQALRVGVTA